MTLPAETRSTPFDPRAIETFRFGGRELDDDGVVTLRYALDDAHAFAERIRIPLAAPPTAADRVRVGPLLDLLHWVAGVSYYKAALPDRVAVDGPAPPPRTAALLEALYSHGLGELAYRNRLPRLPRPAFPVGTEIAAAPPERAGAGPATLVPLGGGKDSVVALEVVRASGRPFALFSVGDAAPIARTAAVAGVRRLIAERRIDPCLLELNARGAINGHVPVTAIVSAIALVTAALNGFDAVALANERSASHGNLVWDGIDVNHQYSKGLAAERLLRDALGELAPGLDCCSVLRGASELGIARAFAGMPAYHGAFTSCNAVFRLDPQLRARSWCRDCPKCRFVFLALAPFSEPAHLAEVFGADLLADPAQGDGFALLTATGGHKPFECVGEEDESIAALRLLRDDPRWRDHAVVARLAREVVDGAPADAGDPARVLAWSDDHEIPADLATTARALLGP